MSDEVQEQPQEQAVDIDTVLAENARLREHNGKLLSEKKAIKAKEQEAEAKAAAAADEAARKSGDLGAYERKIKELSDERDAIAAKAQEIEESSKKQHLSYVSNQKLTQLLSAVAADADALSDLMVLYRDSVKVAIDENGEYKYTYVIDGKETVADDKTFTNMVSSKKPRLTKGNPASGAGGMPQPAGGAGGSTNSGSMVDRARNIIKSQG